MLLELQLFLLVLTKPPQEQTVLEYAPVLANELFIYTFKLSTNGLLLVF
jgi:hypothetical protein